MIITPDKHSNDIRNAINEIRNTNINVYNYWLLQSHNYIDSQSNECKGIFSL